MNKRGIKTWLSLKRRSEEILATVAKGRQERSLALILQTDVFKQWLIDLSNVDGRLARRPYSRHRHVDKVANNGARHGKDGLQLTGR